MPIIGAGISTAACDLPNWRGLVVRGIEHIEQIGTATEAQLFNLRSQLEGSSPDSLIQTAQSLRSMLQAPDGRPGEFPYFLKRQFDIDSSRIANPDIISTVLDLGCPLLATTNYDKLLSMFRPSLDPVTWQEPAKMQLALHKGGVLHLHGIWDQPSSVVFGIEDYTHIVSDPAYRSVLQTLWLDRSLLFIGCSFDGLTDPDFHSLLSWAASTFAGSFAKHYALFRTGSYSVEDTAHFLHKWRIQIVGYGENYSDLPKWIQGISSYRITPSIALSPPNSYIVGRDRETSEIRKLLVAGRTTLLHGIGGIGKTAIAAELVYALLADGEFNRVIWLSGTSWTSVDELYDDLMREIGIPIVATAQGSSKRALLGRVLAERERHLIVIDDVRSHEHIADFMKGCRPDGMAVLVTSRQRQMTFDADLRIGPLSRESAAVLSPSMPR